jgi:hypothetical protein
VPASNERNITSANRQGVPRLLKHTFYRVIIRLSLRLFGRNLNWSEFYDNSFCIVPLCDGTFYLLNFIEAVQHVILFLGVAKTLALPVKNKKDKIYKQINFINFILEKYVVVNM